MTATAEHILQELRQLSEEELRQLREEVDSLLAKVEPHHSPRDAAGDALRALYGKYEGRGLMTTFREERARERAEDLAQNEARLANKPKPIGSHG